MDDLIHSMLAYADGELEIKAIPGIEKAISENKELRKKYQLNNRLNEFMKIQLMLEEIKSDEALPEIENSIKSEMMDRSTGKPADFGLSAYINKAISESEVIEHQLFESEHEMLKHGIHAKASAWVESYMIEKNQNNADDSYSNEIRIFIKNGLKLGTTERILTVKLLRKKIWYRVASIAAILIISFGLWNLFHSNPTPDELFFANYKPYAIRSEITRGNPEPDIKLERLIGLYQKEEYAKVSSELESLSGKESWPAKLKMMYGITQMELNEFEKAADCFINLKSSGQEYSIEAKWYLALCYIKINKINESEKLLIELSETPGYYKSKALDLLSDL